MEVRSNALAVQRPRSGWHDARLAHWFRFGEVAEWSKALDWNSSNIFTGVPGFESLPLRQTTKALIEGLFCLVSGRS